jgi:hypothetical protein
VQWREPCSDVLGFKVSGLELRVDGLGFGFGV